MFWWLPQTISQSLYSLSGKTSYRKISWSLEAVRFGFELFQSLWNLAGTSAALLPRCLSNFRAIRPLQHAISRHRVFTRFGDKTSYRLVNRGPGNDLLRQATGQCLNPWWRRCMMSWHIEAETKWRPFSRRYSKYIFLNENIWMRPNISLKFFPKGLSKNIPSLVKIIIWTNDGLFTGAYMRHSVSMS